MTLYGICVLLVQFGLALAVTNLALWLATPSLLRRFSRVPVNRRPGTILAARFLPIGLALGWAVCVCVPSWLLYEPANTGEEASWVLVAAALIAAAPLLHGAFLGLRMYLKTRDRLRVWENRGRCTAHAHTPFEVVEVKGHDLALCVGGYLKPTIYASAEIFESLEPEELEAALAHETRHATSRDPLRLLWMGSCPDFLRMFGLDRGFREAFKTACEFAADEGAIRGDRETALDLASALLKVARLGALTPWTYEGLADVAVSSAYQSRAELEARVHALANPDAPRRAGVLAPRHWFGLLLASLTLIGLAAAPRVHDLTEQVGRFLAP